MILYNVTIKIDKVVAEEWLNWMKAVHIPDVMKTGYFVEYKICEILHDDEDGGINYAFQYFAKNMEDFQTYQREHAKALQKDVATRYPNKYIAFRTLMKVID